MERLEGVAQDLIRDHRFAPLDRLLPLAAAASAQFHACVARMGSKRLEVHAFLVWQDKDPSDLERRAQTLRSALELACGFFDGRVVVTLWITEVPADLGPAALAALDKVPEGHFLEKILINRAVVFLGAQQPIQILGRSLPEPETAWFEAAFAAESGHADAKGAEAALTAREREETRSRRFLQRSGQRPWVAYGLIGLNVLMYLKTDLDAASFMSHLGPDTLSPDARAIAQGQADSMALVAGGLNQGDLIWGQAEYWRLLASMFLHVNFLHLAMNMVGLYSLGTLLERLAGKRSLLLIYFASGLLGGLLSSLGSLGTSAPGSVGASGAIMGLAGALLALRWRRPPGLPKLLAERIYLQLSKPVLFIFVLGFGLKLIPGRFLLDNLGHLGGLGAGFLLVLIWPGLLAQKA